MLLVINSSGLIVDANGSARDHFLPALPTTWERLVPNDVDRARLESFFSSTSCGTMELRTVDQLCIRLEKGSGKIGAGEPRLLSVTDVTAANEKLDELTRRNIALERLVNLGRTDRQLIGYEIHDGLVQEMTASQLFLESGMAVLGDEAEATALQSFRDAGTWIRRSIDDARRLIQGLEPPEFETLGVVGAVRQLLRDDRFQGFEVFLESNDPLLDLDETLALSIFRMVQEALTNVSKHADANQANVQIHRREDELLIEVVDDGRGFSTDTGGAQRFGLKGMRQRAVAFGGQMEIRSAAGQGTAVTIVVPIVTRQHY